jgi:hypothetical protein
LIDKTPNGCTVFFFGDTSGVFDQLLFSSVDQAEQALRRNGFARFAQKKEAQSFIAVSRPPFHEQPPQRTNIFVGKVLAMMKTCNITCEAYVSSVSNHNS